MKCSVFIATSLDGFIADHQGRVDWLELANLDGEDYGYQAFADDTDVLVMGRNSFETVMGFGQWPYSDKPVIVMSRSLVQLPNGTPASVTLSQLTLAELMLELQHKGFQHAYIDGGRLIQSFLAEDLLDELIVTTLPVTLGQGSPLFSPASVPLLQRWSLQGCQTYSNGVVQRHYCKLTAGQGNTAATH